MIRRILMMFPQFRAVVTERDSAVQESANLRTQLQDQSAQILSLQDRLDFALNDRAELWRMTRECINNERASYQMHVNEQWQKQFGVAPFPDAPQIPAHSTPKPVSNPVIPRSMLPSEAVRRVTAKSLEKWMQS